MGTPLKYAVTGGYGFTGRSIIKKLLSMDAEIINLTNHPLIDEDIPISVKTYPLAFSHPEKLKESLKDTDVLFNTYWIRYPRGSMDYDVASNNSEALFSAAKNAGVRKIVHISAINPDIDSPYPYYRYKKIVENKLIESDVQYAILRPAMIFGDKGILINNLAWFMRKMPVFAVPGNGRYEMQPVFVDDLAELAIKEGLSDENKICDAAGPEIYSFLELLKLLKETVNSRTLLVPMPQSLVLPASNILGRLIGDMILTKDELKVLTNGLLVSGQSLLCPSLLSKWLADNKDIVGKTYMSDIRKN